MLADGTFDPLHYGHVRYLRSARGLGAPLIVRVAPDSDIRAKGRGPFQSRDERAQTVLALDAVDRVCLHDTLADAILDLTPRYLVKGADWRGRLPDAVLAAAQAVGAELVFTDTREKSSSERLYDAR